MVPLSRVLFLEPISTIERGEPHFAKTVDAGLPIQTIFLPLSQRIHEVSAKARLMPNKQKGIKTNDKIFILFFMLASFIERLCVHGV